jgi:serine O-acetyltransferase
VERKRRPTNARNVHVTGGVERLVWRLGRQLDAFAPRPERHPLGPVVERALARAETCFACSALPGYRTADDALQFDPAHADQYAMFVWFCSNEAWRAGDLELAADLFALNKALNGIVCMWDTALPAVFLWIHTVGTMLGKAEYGERFVAYQNVTVGTDRGARPAFGEGTILFAGSKVVGGARIGARSLISLNAVVINETIPADTIAAGSSPQLILKTRRRWLYGDYFRDEQAAR